MNKFRISDYWDEYCDIICLKCKSNLTCHNHPAEEKWISCPVCQTVWDGEFSKRKKKYNTLSNYDWRNPGYKTDSNGEFVFSEKPRILIESRTLVDKELDSNSFSIKCIQPKFTKWHLCSHTTMGWSQDTSAFVHMFNSFKKIQPQKHEQYRLRLLIKDKSKIIKIK